MTKPSVPLTTGPWPTGMAASLRGGLQVLSKHGHPQAWHQEGKKLAWSIPGSCLEEVDPKPQAVPAADHRGCGCRAPMSSPQGLPRPRAPLPGTAPRRPCRSHLLRQPRQSSASWPLSPWKPRWGGLLLRLARGLVSIRAACFPCLAPKFQGFPQGFSPEFAEHQLVCTREPNSLSPGCPGRHPPAECLMGCVPCPGPALPFLLEAGSCRGPAVPGSHPGWAMELLEGLE